MFLSVRITVLSLLLLLISDCSSEKIQQVSPKAAKGIIDLRPIHFDDEYESSIPLDGEWGFHWNEFLNPESKEIFSGTFIRVPSQWQQEKNPEGISYPPYGFASYSLKVLLPENHPPLSFSMSDTGMAYKFYVNGKLLSGNGKTGRTKEEMEIRQRYTVFPVPDSSTELDIVIHNSNFHYYKAGLWQSAVIGPSKIIEYRHLQNIALDLIVASSLLIMGLYHIGLFVNRQKDRSPLYFGMFCILVVLRTITIKERLIFDLFPNLPFTIVHKIEYFSFYFGSLVFMQFIHSMFKEEWNEKLYKGFTYFFLGASVLVLLSPMNTYTRSLIFVQGAILAGIIYTLKILFGALKNRRFGAASFTLGLSIFFIAIIHDILRTRGYVYTPFMASYGLLFFVVSQAIVLSRRFANAFVLAEKLSDELQNLTDELEMKVRQRTKELNDVLYTIQNDLAYAKRIQNDSLFIDYSQFHNLEIFPYYSAMSEVGGDFYGVSIVSQNHYRIFLADVTGHGIQAALITMAVKGIYDDIRKFELSPSEILDIFNDEFFEKYQSLNSLLTCIFVDIYPNERKIQYASAGHPPCILLSEGEIHLLEKTGRMIGIKKANMYRTVEMPFSENDRILLFSDGIYEQFDSEGKEFGEDRLRELIQKTSNLRLKSSIEAVISDLNLFLGRQEKQDDITILGIELKKSEQDRQTD